MIKRGIMLIGLMAIVMAIFVLPVNTHADDICGDANGDANVNIADAVYLMSHLFKGGVGPESFSDVDECGSINISDVIYLFDYIFMGGPAPCEGSVDCNLPTGNNTISLGCPVEVANTVDSFSVPVYLTSDVPIKGFSLGFTYNSSYIEISSLESSGLVPPGSISLTPLAYENKFIAYMIPIPPDTFPLAPQENSLLFNLWFRVIGGAPAHEINIEAAPASAFSPDIEFILSVDGGGSISPNYVDCGTTEIIITGEDYICGDANADGEINLVDVIYIIRYIFQGGYVPQPLGAADATCNGFVDISDVIWIVNYIFTGGNLPCDMDGDGFPDC